MKAPVKVQDVEAVISSDRKLSRFMLRSLTKFAPYARYSKKRNRISMGERLKEIIVGTGALHQKLSYSHIPWEKLAWEFIVRERTATVLQRAFGRVRRK